jgi:uncharacterized protein YraI
MRRYFTPIVAGLVAVTAVPAVALAQDAIVTTDLNMRAGPSTAFPVVDVLEERTPVEVHGCVAGYSWCDVSADANRGWVSGAYLSYAAGGSYVPLVEYVSDYDVPIISFSVGSYWDSYYRNRPWYGERARWRERWDANWRDIRRDRRDIRVDRRRDRRDDRIERRIDRRDARVERRFDRREDRLNRGDARRDARRDARIERRVDRGEATRERRVNRVERRMDRRDFERSRGGGEMRQMQRQERMSPRSGDGGQRLDRGGRRGRDG